MASSQRDEIEVLLSVHPDILATTDVPAGLEVKLDIAIELERERVFDLISSISDPSSPSDGIQVRLSHLPALLLTVLFPPEYPSSSDPIVRNIHARYAWLAPGLVSRLGARLEQRWRVSVENGTRDEGVLWRWVEDIRTGAFLDSLGSTIPFASSSAASSSTRPITLPHPAPKTLYAHLVEHELVAKQAQFSAQAFTCGICLAPQRGARCIQLPCPRTHVFCFECLRLFWGLCVSEGEVGKVACPGVECVQEREKTKDGDTVGGAEWEDAVRRVLSEEEVMRWKWLRVKQAAEKGAHIGPQIKEVALNGPTNRPEHGAVSRPGVSGTGDTARSSGRGRIRMDEASHMRFVRVHFLRRVSANVRVEFIEAYVALDKDDPRRQVLKAQYGKKELKRMKMERWQEKKSAAWLEERTMACPGCNTHIEKSQGCNHMRCARCDVHFCYLCGARLRADSPYKHFKLPGSCYGKLFD